MAIISIIGSGFSGLSAACYLAAAGHEIHVFEKNSSLGGRARQFKSDNGYLFDMGPSWYWMPDVFENFFKDFGYQVTDFYDLILLDPGFEMVLRYNKTLIIPANYNELRNLFESIEPDSANQLDKFMKEAEYKYETGMKKMVLKPGLSITELLDWQLIKGIFRLQVFSSFKHHIRRYFSHPSLLALMEFPVLFLGAMPSKTPALYSLMNYAGLKLGTYYPMGGFGKIIDAMTKVAELSGVKFYLDTEVKKIETFNKKVTGVQTSNYLFKCDAVMASADYHHVETQLLPKAYKNYSEKYWARKSFAPSCLIFYLGISKKIKNLQHHTLFFDKDFEVHSKEIYENPQWPSQPLFYVCCPSKTDELVAPKGHENLFLLMPISSGLKDDKIKHEKYFKTMMERLEQKTKEKIIPYIDFKKSYCIDDFINDYNSYKGNAYGLSNTLMQTANLKPKIKNNNIQNLFYTGQLTVPGPGVPPCIISGKVSAQQLINYFEKI